MPYLEIGKERKGKMKFKINDRLDGYFGYNFALYDEGYYPAEYIDTTYTQFLLFLRYIETLGKIHGFKTGKIEILIKSILKYNMQKDIDDMYSIENEELMYQYDAALDELAEQFFSVLDKNDIMLFSINISRFFVDAEEDDLIPQNIEQVLDQLDGFPLKAKEILLKVLSKDKIIERKLKEAAESIDEKYILFDIVIDYNYSKYKDMYKKRFGNDDIYEISDKSYPCLANDLCIISKVLDNGVRCDVFLSGMEEQAYYVKASLFNPLYFFNLLDLRKKLGVL